MNELLSQILTIIFAVAGLVAMLGLNVALVLSFRSIKERHGIDGFLLRASFLPLFFGYHYRFRHDPHLRSARIATIISGWGFLAVITLTIIIDTLIRTGYIDAV